MKNKVELKKCILTIGLAVILFSVLAGVIHDQEFASYQREYNEALGQLLVGIQEKYPAVSEHELISVLNGEEQAGNVDEKEIESAEFLLQKYGIDIEKESVLLNNQQNRDRYTIVWILFSLGLAGCVTFLFLRYNKKKDRELEAITQYIEEINRKNYGLKMDGMSEDELSMLKTEIYKTTIMLKEVAENSRKDKENLKNTLADISHQIKTPLTSILVLLDNLIDDPDMEPEVGQDFMLDIKREIGHIQFLVEALLKMTKLEAGTVIFLREQTRLTDICLEAIRNVEPLCDLKNVELAQEHELHKAIESIRNDGWKEIPHKEDDSIYCDFRWQVEAVTNILKNCVEHAPEESKVLLKIEKNQIYGSIRITDFGPGIEKEDLKHLLERFYRGKNASTDGVGIGLSLAKSIIESDNGRIYVESSKEKTVFELKYFY